MTEREGVTVLDFAGRDSLHKENALPDAEEIIRDIALHPGHGVVLSFEGVKFVSSRYLGFLVELNRKLAEAGASLHLAAIAPELRKLFGFTRLDTVIALHDTVDGAVAAAEKETTDRQ